MESLEAAMAEAMKQANKIKGAGRDRNKDKSSGGIQLRPAKCAQRGGPHHARERNRNWGRSPVQTERPRAKKEEFREDYQMDDTMEEFRKTYPMDERDFDFAPLAKKEEFRKAYQMDDTMEDFRKNYPMDERAFDFLFSSTVEVWHRVFATFQPRGEGGDDYSGAITAFVKKCRRDDDYRVKKHEQGRDHSEDWYCPNQRCQDYQFARNKICRKCGKANPWLEHGTYTYKNTPQEVRDDEEEENRRQKFRRG
jgi:hypothetical protein